MQPSKEYKAPTSGRCGMTKQTVLLTPEYISDGICKLFIEKGVYCNVPVSEHRDEHAKLKTDCTIN